MRKEIQNYFGGYYRNSNLSETNTSTTCIEDRNDGYAIIGASSVPCRSTSASEGGRSPTDPLPLPADIPGYLKTDFQRYKIFNPAASDQ